MSRSSFKMKLDFDMLDGRWQCRPEMRDSTGGHMHFSTGTLRLRTGGPASWHFDELDEPYDRERWIADTKARLLEEFTLSNTLDHLLGRLFDMAREHCKEHHEDLREAEARGIRMRKGH